MPKAKKKIPVSSKNPYYVYSSAVVRWLGLGLPKKRLYRKLLFGFIALVILCVAGMYGIARYYIAKHADEPLVIGATFTSDYARGFGLDPQDTMDAIIRDLGIKRLRLVSYWDDGEPKQGQYDFDDLDWQFKKAEENGVQISLAIGLRQPRWPECHMPKWAADQPKEVWSQELKTYMGKVIDRYKNSPSLVSYQLENEYFLSVFGKCPDHSKDRLVDEFNFVKSKDPNKPLIVTRSNNAVPSWPVGSPRADINGASIYKRVWDKTVTNRYFEYPVPAWFYAFLAGGAEITTGRNTFIHELQTEAWLPDNKGFNKSDYKMNDIDSIPEQDKSLNAENLGERFDYGVATGMRTIDVWGAEWWYWRKEKAGDPSLWNIAKQKITQYNGKNLQWNFANNVPKGTSLDISSANMRSALGNLIDNSIKFTKSGGSIAVTAELQENNFVFTVKDTGVGISKEEIPKLFTKFHRGTSTMNYDYEGIGIGLYLSKLILEQHGGRIGVRSEIGKGTVFRVYLPLSGTDKEA